MYRANLIAHNLHTSQENRRKQEILFEKENYLWAWKSRGIEMKNRIQITENKILTTRDC